VVAHACNPNTQEVEAGGSWVQGQHKLHNETLSKKSKGWRCTSVVEHMQVLCWVPVPHTHTKKIYDEEIISERPSYNVSFKKYSVHYGLMVGIGGDWRRWRRLVKMKCKLYGPISEPSCSLGMSGNHEISLDIMGPTQSSTSGRQDIFCSQWGLAYEEGGKKVLLIETTTHS
jgi:hypothetical protein